MPPKIHTYASLPEAFFVNSFVVEGAAGLVLIDTQFLLSSARELVAMMAALGKPLEAIIITHPHPDHFNGLPTVLEAFGPVRVYATAATIAGITASQGDKRAAWTPVYGADYPPTDAVPDHRLSLDETVTLAGIDFRIVDLGPGESADITVIHIPDADTLIVSDMVYNRSHPWMAEHRTDAWLAQIARVQADFPAVTHVLPGHGVAGGRELLDEQRAYIEQFRALVAAHTRDGALDDAALAAIRAATTAGREGWPLDMLISMNAAAFAAEGARPQ